MVSWKSGTLFVLVLSQPSLPTSMRVTFLLMIGLHCLNLGALRHHPTVNQHHAPCHDNHETQRYEHKKHRLYTLASGTSQPHPLRQNTHYKRRQKCQMEALHQWCVQRVYKRICDRQSS